MGNSPQSLSGSKARGRKCWMPAWLQHKLMAWFSQKPSCRTLETTQEGLNSVREAAVTGKTVTGETLQLSPRALGDCVHPGVTSICLFIHSLIHSFACSMNTLSPSVCHTECRHTPKSEMDSESNRSLWSQEAHPSRTEAAWLYLPDQSASV